MSEDNHDEEAARHEALAKKLAAKKRRWCTLPAGIQFGESQSDSEAQNPSNDEKTDTVAPDPNVDRWTLRLENLENRVEQLDRLRLGLLKQVVQVEAHQFSSRLKGGIVSSRVRLHTLADRLYQDFSRYSHSLRRHIAHPENPKALGEVDRDMFVFHLSKLAEVFQRILAAIDDAVSQSTKLVPLSAEEKNGTLSARRGRRRRSSASRKYSTDSMDSYSSGSDSIQSSAGEDNHLVEEALLAPTPTHLPAVAESVEHTATNIKDNLTPLQKQIYDELQPIGADELEPEVKGQEDRAAKIRDTEGTIKEISDMFADFQSIVKSQEELLAVTEGNLKQTKVKTARAAQQLSRAARFRAFGMSLFGGLLGAAVGGPAGAAVGAKTAVGLGLGGAVLGAHAGKTIASRVKARALESDFELEEQLQKEHEEEKHPEVVSNSTQDADEQDPLLRRRK